MEDNNITSAGGTQTSTDGTQIDGKTFTQEDVNRIVQERLAKERSKAAAGGGGNDDIAKRTAELDMRERRLNAVEELRKNGLPDYLVDALNMNTDEDFQKSLEAIKKMKGETTSEPRAIGTISPIGDVTPNGNGGDPMRTAFGLK